MSLAEDGARTVAGDRGVGGPWFGGHETLGERCWFVIGFVYSVGKWFKIALGEDLLERMRHWVGSARRLLGAFVVGS